MQKKWETAQLQFENNGEYTLYLYKTQGADKTRIAPSEFGIIVANLGNDGWELVSVNELSGGSFRMWFKRPPS